MDAIPGKLDQNAAKYYWLMPQTRRWFVNMIIAPEQL